LLISYLLLAKPSCYYVIVSNLIYWQLRGGGGPGSKWSIRALWKYLMEQEGLTQEQVDKVWMEMKSVALRTFIAAESHIHSQMNALNLSRNNCFEVWPSKPSKAVLQNRHQQMKARNMRHET
jgi:hypothetical protein